MHRRTVFAALVLAAAVTALSLPRAAAQESLALGYIAREGQETKEGPPAPPWTRTRVEASFFGVPARRTLSGDVTILPHDHTLPPATLAIQSMAPYQREECTGELSKFRRVTLPDLPGEAYRTYVSREPQRGAAWVSSALVVHPARPHAKTLDKATLTARDMPGGYPLATLEAAFDLSGGGRPDIVQVDYCCHNPALDNARCIAAGGKDGGARCLALFRKTKAGWRRIFRQRLADC